MEQFLNNYLPKLHIPPSLYATYLMPIDLIGADVDVINERAEAGVFPSFDCVVPAIICAFFFGLIRKFLQPNVFTPLAMSSMNLNFTEQDIDPAVEKGVNFKLRDKALLKADYLAYCVNSGADPLVVGRYVANRNRNRAVESKVVKFNEAFWRFAFYFVFCVMGYMVLFVPETKPWVLDTKDHWTDFVNFTWVGSPLMAVFCYAQLGCYIHQLLWTEVNRSDAWEMITHHIITIFLILFSFLANFTRIGCSILLCHDMADIFLESAKMFNYISKNNKRLAWTSKLCDGLFVCFVVAFAITRLYIYPRYLVGSLLYDAPAVYGGVWAGWYIYVVLLVGLQCLHIFWFVLIVKMVIRLLFVGEVEGDVRSDDEFDAPINEETDDKSPISTPATDDHKKTRASTGKKNKKKD